MEKATHEYWSNLWTESALRKPIDVNDASLRNHGKLCFHRYFTDAFADLPPDARLVELGCASSAWLPYFHRQFGFKISGVDYSAVGCRQAHMVLQRDEVDGEIYEADIFDPPSTLRGAFDIVVSFGLVEHFTDTAAALKACASFLNKNGKMVTLIPNMNGLLGYLQKRINKKIYDIHVPLNAEELRSAHEKAGLVVESCHYFMFAQFGVINFGDASHHVWNRWLSQLLQGVTAAFWALERLGIHLKPNRLTSPYIFCVSRKRVS